MDIAKVFSSSVVGIEAYRVEVETDIGEGLPAFNIVGLPDATIRESRDRIKAAIKNSGFNFPYKKLTVNLAPANIKKEGSCFDLPIALSILAAAGVVKAESLADTVFCGELSLDGRLRSICGVLPIATSMRSMEKRSLVVPPDNASEAAVVESVEVYAPKTLTETVDFLLGAHPLRRAISDHGERPASRQKRRHDFADVKGQEHVKRGLEIAAAGGHNVLMIGPPGSGKSMLAKRLPTILSEMVLEEALETSKVHSVAGLLFARRGLVRDRPFRSPHHTISDASLVGGGSTPSPGEISLAHNGVLFLDELPEFRKNVLEVLRQPMEDGQITISRVAGKLTYPAKFMLIAAMNPCPCGYFTDPKRACHCSPFQIQRYLSKISGPLLDRIDIHLEVPRLNVESLGEKRRGETSETISGRVERTRARQHARYSEDGAHCNAHLESKELEKYCVLDGEASELLKTAILELGISARAYDKILRVSRTIADMEGSEAIGAHHISEAIGYRSLDRNVWG